MNDSGNHNDRGALSNLPDEDLDVPLGLSEAPSAQLQAIDREERDIATGQLNKVIESMDYYHRPDKGSGKLFEFNPVLDGIRKDYEYVIDGLLRYGPNAFSGPRGMGKSSTLAPMICAIAGLIPHYPLEIKLRRRVIMFTEDREQMGRIFDAMIEDGYMDVTLDELNRWVHLVDSIRIAPSEVAQHADELAKMWTPNAKADGTDPYKAGPLVVFDTISSGLEIENSSDNDDVSREIATMRQALDGKAALLLVGHTAKDAGNRAGQTMLGAQAWEANTIGSITLKANGDNRYIQITKDRFSAPIDLFAVDPNRTDYRGVDVLGNLTTIHGLYNVIKPMTKEEAQASKDAKQAERAEQKLKEDTDTLMSKLKEMQSTRPDGVKKGDLYGALPGKPERWRPIIKSLKDKAVEVVADGTSERISLIKDKEVV